MTPLDDVKDLIKKNIDDAIVDVYDMTGTMDHLEIFVASDIFKGKMLLDQHQIVMDILKESLKEKIHAVKIKTMTLDKFNQLRG